MLVIEQMKKYRSNIPPKGIIESCRQKGKAKREQVNMQALENVFSLCMYSSFLKFNREVFSENFFLLQNLNCPKRLIKIK